MLPARSMPLPVAEEITLQPPSQPALLSAAPAIVAPISLSSALSSSPTSGFRLVISMFAPAGPRWVPSACMPNQLPRTTAPEAPSMSSPAPAEGDDVAIGDGAAADRRLVGARVEEDPGAGAAPVDPVQPDPDPVAGGVEPGARAAHPHPGPAGGDCEGVG